MVQHWYQSILFEKFGCANCTLAELKALPDRDGRIRIYTQSLAPRLFPLIKLLLAGFADQQRTEGPDTVLAQLARITGDEGTAKSIYDQYSRNKNFYVMGAFVEIIKAERLEFEHPDLEDRGTIQRYLRFNPRDELIALAFIVENEKERARARKKPRGKTTRFDDLLANYPDDPVAIAKIVQEAMGKITDEKEVLKYLRNKPTAFVEVMHESRPGPQDPTVERNAYRWLSQASSDAGVDMVARSGSEIRLIEFNETQGASVLTADNVEHLNKFTHAILSGALGLPHKYKDLPIISLRFTPERLAR